MGGVEELVAFHKLFSFADWADYGLMAVGTLGAVANGLSLPLMTLIFGALVDSFGIFATTSQLLPKVSKMSLDFVYLALGASAAAFLQVACWMITGERQAGRIRSMYLKTILRQDVAFFDLQANTGEVIERMSADTVLIQDAMGEKVGKFIQLIATFFGGFVIAFLKGWFLTLVMLSTIPALVISGAVMSFAVGKLSSRGQTAYAQAATVVDQTIGSIRTVAAFTGEKLAIEKYNKSLEKAYKTGVQQGLASGLGMGVVHFIVFSSYGMAVWLGGKMIIEKGYTGGDVINIIFAVLTGSMSLGQASPCLTAYGAGRAAAFKMFEAISRKPNIDAYNMDGKVLDDFRGDIELRDVCFSYPSRPDHLIFHDFTLSIPSGTTTALVGQSGSGKSTVISLIERFYDPKSGYIRIDGVDLKEFQLRWIRKQIGLVSQEPVLFTSTIRENIAYGKDDATMEEIRFAIELANAAKFIDKLPQGIETMVGDHGTQLSGGQKQRIAIARAILKNPKILLLDEATSALDTESERNVQEALDRVMINRSTLIVAHRLTTIRNADTIAVLHHGKIVEQGTHSVLVNDPEGQYNHLIRLQEISKYDGTNNDKNLEITMESPDRQLSQRLSSIRSISGRLSSSSRRSFSISFGVSNVVNSSPMEPKVSSMHLQGPKKVSLIRLVLLNKPEFPVLFLGIIAAVANGVILPIFGVLLSNIIKTFYEPPHELRKDSRVWALVFVGLGTLSLLVQPSRSYLFGVAGCKLIRRIRSMCFEKVVYMEVSWFDEAEHSSGMIGARLSTDATLVRGLVGDALGLLVQNVATAIAGLVIAFEANWQMSLIVLVLLPLIGVNGYIQIKFLQGFSADTKKMYEEASKVASDAVGSIRTVASFCAEDKVMVLYHKRCEGPLQAGIKQGVVSGIGFGISLFLLFSVYACSFYVGARLIVAGKANFPEVFRVFFALTMAAIGVSQTGSIAPDVSKTKSAVGSMFEILDRKSNIDSSDDGGVTLDLVKGEIELRAVRFRYPSRMEVQILKGMTLNIEAGHTVALVGESGSGKSTVISLLQRLYDPEAGEIKLDGVELRKLRLRWLRQQMGVVSQEPVLFNDTISANIAYGQHNYKATQAEVEAAAEKANAHTFISGLQPNGYMTLVGERGIQLSGGQKQRVAIARAIIGSPAVLLLDEATSALDAQSEKAVHDSLDRLMVRRTTIVVAHRLSTVKAADMIVVLKNGVIVEKGSHDELMTRKDGIYVSLLPGYR